MKRKKKHDGWYTNKTLMNNTLYIYNYDWNGFTMTAFSSTADDIHLCGALIHFL